MGAASAAFAAGDGSVSYQRRLVQRLIGDAEPDVATSATVARWRTMFEWARGHDIGVARLAGAHVDALCILAEAGRTAAPATLMGIWGPSGDRRRPLLNDGGTAIDGTVTLCSGVGVVDRALVVVEDRRGRELLAEVTLRDVAGAQPLTVASSSDPWATPALRSTRTATMSFGHHPVERIVGPPDWYRNRPGFWHGAVGAAACWAGAAASFFDGIARTDDTNPHRVAAWYAMRAEVLLALAVLGHAGRATDANPQDAAGAGQRALAVRHLIERSCMRLLDRYECAWGSSRHEEVTALDRRASDLRIHVRAETVAFLADHRGAADGVARARIRT